MKSCRKNCQNLVQETQYHGRWFWVKLVLYLSTQLISCPSMGWQQSGCFHKGQSLSLRKWRKRNAQFGPHPQCRLSTQNCSTQAGWYSLKTFLSVFYLHRLRSGQDQRMHHLLSLCSSKKGHSRVIFKIQSYLFLIEVDPFWGGITRTAEVWAHWLEVYKKGASQMVLTMWLEKCRLLVSWSDPMH